MKAGLLKKVAYGCPFGYYGFDAIIPVLIEVDVEVLTENEIVTILGLQNPTEVQKRSETHVSTEDRIKIEKKHVYSFIGVQFKVGQASKIETLTKTDPFFHLNSQNYENWEIQAIRENFLVLVLSSENDAEKPKLSAAQVNNVKEPMYNKNRNDVSESDAFHRNLKNSFYQVPEVIDNIIELDYNIDAPKFPHDIPKPSAYAHIKIAPHVNICGINWSHDKHICVWSSSLLAFKNLLSDEALDICHQILRNDRSIFKNQIDPFALKSVADAVLNTHFAYYPNSDPMLRKFRGQEKIQPVLTNFSHWKSNLNVENKPEKTSD